MHLDLTGLARRLYELAFCAGLLGAAPYTWDTAEQDYRDLWLGVAGRLVSPRPAMTIELGVKEDDARISGS
jgi:hypothetical protein